MHFLVLNGSSVAGPFEQVVAGVCAHLRERGHAVELVRLRDLELRQCVGCWDCWVKSPGRCRLPDDQEALLVRVLEAHRVVIASPLLLGFPTALTKRCIERFIPLLHPFVTLRQGECHHEKRYDRYPDLALLLEREADTDAEDLDIVADIFARCALNFHGALVATATSDQSIEEVCDALARV
jgi:multimeric flavodoxin WrbA